MHLFSLYPSVCLNGQFPVGDPEILISHQSLSKVQFKNCKAYYDGLEIQGLIHLTILADSHTKWPFLQHRFQVNKGSSRDVL